jgi:DNA modification methylase
MALKHSMIKDIHPQTPTYSLTRDFSGEELNKTFPLDLASALVGMSSTFAKKALGSKGDAVSLKQILQLLDMDAFAETFIPRSRIPRYLLNWQLPYSEQIPLPDKQDFIQGSATSLLPRLPRSSIQCVVTSTPYWGLRLYNDSFIVHWADGESCPFGNEQTPEAFIRHTAELLFLLKPAITPTGSVWWNLMDTYNTRTQIRENAAETLRAMRGEDDRGWHDYDCRRYSAGHSFLNDGEQCMIPSRVAERASRLGYLVKSIITWKKNGSMPETVETRVTRELEYIIHLSVERSPLFNKAAYRELPESLGGRNASFEGDKLTDVWCFRTSGGRDGHGAQFPSELPSRCIALSTNEGDLVLDPFIGAGTTAVAARSLGRRCLGFDVSDSYLEVARNKANGTSKAKSRAAAELPLLEISQ